MFTKDLFIEKNNEDIVKNYIEYYFNKRVGYHGKVYYEKFKIYDEVTIYVSILKDDIERLNVKNGGTGSLRQKPNSIFVFTVINGESYIKYFGVDSKYRKIKDYNNIDFSTFELDNFKESKRCSNPQRFHKDLRINEVLHKYIFNYFKENKKSLLANSYLYSTVIISDGNISKNNFSSYYFNKEYKFVQNTNPQIINQTKSVDKTSRLVKEISNELDAIQNSNEEIIDLVKAYTGDLTLSQITNNNYTNIEQDIESGVEYIIVEGMARTGKTVIAMRLLNKYPESNLLLMNPYFYKQLERTFQFLKVEFPYNRIYHHKPGNKILGSWKKGESINKDFLIVDEAQRLGHVDRAIYKGVVYDAYDELSLILDAKNHKHTIFLGDNYQKMNPNTDNGIQNIKDTLFSQNKEYKLYYFDYPLSLSVNVLESIKYILSERKLSSYCSLNDFEIKTFNDEKEFVDCYNADNTFKKHMATIYMCDNNYYAFNKFKESNVDLYNRFDYFLNEDIKSSYMLTPFELISRELDVIYIYVPKQVSIYDGKLCYNNKINLSDYFINQLYILMTRAKMSINLYFENKQVYDYITNKINDIKCNENIKFANTESFTEENLDRKERLKEIIEERGITRLIHFTDINNIDSIKENGLMSRIKLDEKNLLYTYNDQKRFDNRLDGICLSITNPNTYLLNTFKKKNPTRKYVALILSPSLLYEINNKSGNNIADRLYCNYNAASSYTKKSNNDLDIMFEKTASGYTVSRGCWMDTRNNVDDNEPTCNQAEILFFEDIPPQFIIDIKEI